MEKDKSLLVSNILNLPGELINAVVAFDKLLQSLYEASRRSPINNIVIEANRHA
jgi:hypothetical protein